VKQLNEIKQITEEIFDEVVLLRRTIHQNPELEFCEAETAALICAQLDKLQIPYKKGIAKTGVVGLIQAEKATKTLLLRADMDALPLQEETGLPYASKKDGVAHACGHDAHVAILLGTAMVLSRLRQRLAANIKLVFQPAEETTGGALPMIEAGILENPHVDAAASGHVMTNVPAGKVLIKDNEVMAAPDDFDMIVHGRGGHGAYPHTCVDPIAVCMQILSAWNTLSARFTTPLEKHLISVNMFQAGTCYNVIPDDAYIKGTVRMYNNEVRKTLPEAMEKIAVQIAAAFGATCEFTYNFRYPPLINDKSMADAFRQSAKEILGEEQVIEGVDPSMAGDDFAYFAQAVPSVFVNYGAANAAIGADRPLHSSDFIIDEACLKNGVLAMSKFALDFGR